MTHLPALEGLIERLSNATGPDRALDLLLAQALVPDVVVLRRNDDDTGNEPHTYWEYTGSVDAALALAERLLPSDWGCQVGKPSSKFGLVGWYGCVFSGDGVMFDDMGDVDGRKDLRPRGGYRPTGALALIIAALKALRSLTKLEG